MATYWIVGCSTAEKNKESIFSDLRNRIHDKTKLCEDVLQFGVPLNLKFGSFDSLIKLVDDIGKYDSQVESVIRRVERQMFELDPSTELNVISQRQQVSVEDYVSKFSWDEIKYPRSRSVQDNIQAILTSIQKLDEEIKVKTQQYTDAKQHAALYARKDQASHIQRDLVDLLTPENVKDGDFVYSEHLTTLIVVVPRGADNEFVNHYHNFDQYVVPGSAERISADDKEGNSLWRVVMFKSAIDAFKTACRTHRYTVREFIFDGKKYGEIVQARQQSEIDIKTHEANLRRVCQAAFSDAMVAWIHMKAVRTFVEAVLRYGVPPNFGAFLIKVGKYTSKTQKLRTELLQVFANTGGMYGDGVHADDGADEESGEYYPYVYIPLSPTMNRVG